MRLVECILAIVAVGCGDGGGGGGGSGGGTPASEPPPGPVAGTVQGYPFTEMYSESYFINGRFVITLATWDVSCPLHNFPKVGDIEFDMTIPMAEAQPGTYVITPGSDLTAGTNRYTAGMAGGIANNVIEVGSGTIHLDVLDGTHVVGWVVVNDKLGVNVAGHFDVKVCSGP